MKNIEFSNCMQVIGIIGILPNRVCGRARSNISMDLQFSNNLPSETRATELVKFWRESFDWAITFLGTEMLKWFNHQSVDNSIFFSVGRNFPKLVVCIVVGQEGFCGWVDISINGYEYCDEIEIDGIISNLLFSPTQRSLQRLLNESNPTDQNRVEVSLKSAIYGRPCPRKWGVHVECTCPPQEDDAVDYGYSLMHLFGIL